MQLPILIGQRHAKSKIEAMRLEFQREENSSFAKEEKVSFLLRK